MIKDLSQGIYVVVDPRMEAQHVLNQLMRIKNEKIAALQILEIPESAFDSDLLQTIIELFCDTSVPVLINNQWALCKELNFDGVHFDVFPDNLWEIQQRIGRPFLKGLTLENDLSKVKQAEEMEFNYFSFCSLFPSSTIDNCEIVSPNTVMKCREYTQLPVFLAGGINLENITSLDGLPFEGIAMVSSVMNADKPEEVLRKFNTLLKN